MIIKHLGPFFMDGKPKISYARIILQCDFCKEKQWETGLYARLKRENDYCQSCKNILGISGMKGKKHSEKTKQECSKRNAGDKNPAKRLDVREKLSKALKGRAVPWLAGKKRPEHSKFMSKWMNFIWKNDCQERDNRMAKLKEIRTRLQRGHSKLHDQIKFSLNEHGINCFKSEQILGRIFVDEICYEKKIVIEIHGDFWHANPKKYQADKLMTYPGRKILAKEVWRRDADRLKLINQLGYNVIIIWESDWYADQLNQIIKIKEALNE